MLSNLVQAQSEFCSPPQQSPLHVAGDAGARRPLVLSSPPAWPWRFPAHSPAAGQRMRRMDIPHAAGVGPAPIGKIDRCFQLALGHPA